MTVSTTQTSQVYVNVMELLVQEEIDKQLKFYPSSLKTYLNRVEVATYALNRLPPLYASSQIGKEQQIRLGKQKYKEQITAAIRRSLAAIERDPLRQSTPIISQSDIQYQEAKLALKRLQNFLHEHQFLANHQELSWNNLTGNIQRALNKMTWREVPQPSDPSQSNCQIYHPPQSSHWQ